MKYIRKCPGCSNNITYSRRSGLVRADNNRSECRSCYSRNKLANKDYLGAEKYENGKWYVYHLPAEYYVGITSTLLTRLSKHANHHKRDVRDWIVVGCYDKVEDALIHEAKLHSMGYLGCAKTPDIRLNREIYE